MNYYEQLLEAYQLVKKRKFKLTEAVKLNPQGEQKAKQYISQAVSKASMPDYQVPVAEIPNTAIWVAREGKSAGKIVFNGLPGRIGRPMPIDPAGPGALKQNYQEFVSILSGEEELQKDPAMDPNDPESVMANQTSQVNYAAVFDPKLMEIGQAIFANNITLLDSNFYFKGPGTLRKGSWLHPGTDKTYKTLFAKIMGNQASMVKKLGNAKGIKLDEATGSLVMIPITDDEKVAGFNTYSTALEKCAKFNKGTFTLEDASWISSRVVYDDTGVWFRDPVDSPYGVCFSYSKGMEEATDKMFKNFVESYNKNYQEWCDSHDVEIDSRFLIKKQDLSQRTSSFDVNELNHIRGNAAEHIQVISHLLAKGLHTEAQQELELLYKEYGETLHSAFAYVDEFERDMSAGVEDTAKTKGYLNNLYNSVKDKDMKRIVAGVVKKCLVLDSKSVLLRNPDQLLNVGTSRIRKGMKADMVELYSTGSRAKRALSKYNLTPEQMSELIGKDETGATSINVGIKTVFKLDATKVGEGKLDFALKSLRFTDPKFESFMDSVSTKLGGWGNIVSKNEFIEMGNQVQSDMDKVSILFSKLNLQGVGSTDIRNQTLKMVNDFISTNYGYDNALDIDFVNTLDVKNPRHMEYISMRVQREIFRQKILSGIKSKDPVTSKKWKFFLGMLFGSIGAAEQNQLTDIRVLNTQQVYTIDHNNAIFDVVNKYINGEYVLSDSFGTFALGDPSKDYSKQMIVMKMSGKTGATSLHLSLKPSYIRRINLAKSKTQNESVMDFIVAQHNLLGKLILEFKPLHTSNS